MPERIGPLLAEVTNPEREKFTAALVLVHGLWERAPAWRHFAGYLAHRGWRCVAVERRAEAPADLTAHVADLRAALAALGAPPVVVGHDLGAVVALHCAAAARAVVAVAPLAGPPFAAPPAALQRAGNWYARRRGAPLRAPRGAWRRAYPAAEVAEPAALVRQIAAGEPPLPVPTGAAPRAVFAPHDDEVSSAAAAGALARHVGAELHVLRGVGHAVLSAPGWEAHVAAVHRWIIQRLGVDLLALYDEAMQPE
jgi:pimeloyl-ACP methyl ester carboxylesterase